MPERSAAASESESRIRILLVDDHPIYRDGLELLLGSIPGFEVVAAAGDGAEAVEAAREHGPDVIVMDIQMPVMDGVEATRRIVADDPGAGIIVLTMSEDDESVLQAMRAGARGYLLKAASQEDIAQAIRSVAGGGVIFGAALAGRVAEFFARASAPASATPFPQLTPREREILDLIAAGRTNPQIAQILFLSPKTVRNHVSMIFTKLHVDDRGEAVVMAREAGLGKL
ncbi:response regulator transcription factor [Protaetiibacter sp. SSC-01]|uniref:response regulator n=1 Tax=Protaetiibacter sp. SSC-01 TaxID=2759943 RepID=UPI00223A8394|nr:response regulator transcription factor [Protaetiibacter sp. SSC-01]